MLHRGSRPPADPTASRGRWPASTHRTVRRRAAQWRATQWRATQCRATAVAALCLLFAVAGCRSSRGEQRPEPFRRVTPPVAFEMLRDSPELPILDVRPASEFHGDLGHLMNARNIPLSDLPLRFLELLDLRESTFLVYCRDDECEDAMMSFLAAHGFEDAMLIAGGIEAWIADGFGTVGVGDPPEHQDR